MSSWSEGRRPLTLAILALGGEGGGVLADWIVATAERAGFYAQNTSVAGVAQRTGATVYYVEMLPPADDGGRAAGAQRTGHEHLPHPRRGRRRHRLRAHGVRPRRSSAASPPPTARR